MAAVAAATSAALAAATLEGLAVAASAASAVPALEVSAATSVASVGASAEWGLRAAAQDWEPAPSVSAAESAGSPDSPLPASAPVCRWRGCPAADLQPPRPGHSGGRRYAR